MVNFKAKTSIYIISTLLAISSLSSAMAVPARMLLSAKMEAAQSMLSKALLSALHIDTESPIPSVKSSDAIPFSDVIPSHTGSSGSICFGKYSCCYLSLSYPPLFIVPFFFQVVRRPG